MHALLRTKRAKLFVDDDQNQALRQNMMFPPRADVRYRSTTFKE